jgi:parallel beta-helix repeat protein
MHVETVSVWEMLKSKRLIKVGGKVMNKNIGILIVLSILAGGFYVFLPISDAAPYTTPDSGVTWTMDDLVANSGGTVTGGGGTYVITDNVYIAPSDTLIVQPGETLKFDFGVNLTINGTLIADGDASNIITFTSNSPFPFQGDWGSIKFEDTSSDANCIINNSRIEYSFYGIFCEHASPRIMNSTITMNLLFGIISNASSPIIDNNTISSNMYGVACGYPSQPAIKNNDISTNFVAGIFSSDSDPEIENNSISGSTFAILCTLGSPTIKKNTISSTDLYGVLCTNVTDADVTNNIMIDTQMIFFNSSISRLWLINSIATTVNCTYPIPDLNVDSNSILLVKNYLHVKVMDDMSAPMQDAWVYVADDGVQFFSGQTQADGYVRWIMVTDRTYNQSNIPTENRTAITVENGSWVFTCLTSADPSDINMFTSHLEIFQGTPGFGIGLEYGWNLISIPLIQSDTNVGSVLSPISGVYDAVQKYNVSDTQDPWKHNHTMKPFDLNDFHDIDHMIGFWIRITNMGGVLFTPSGTQPSVNQTIALHIGWNLVGYPSQTSYNRTDGLNDVKFGTDVDAIYWFDASTKTWYFMNSNDPFVPGRGYWIYSKVETTWEVPL